MMVLTVMFFVFSCVLSLTPENRRKPRRRTSRFCLTANHFNNPMIAYIAPVIAFVAITKSFPGHYGRA